MPETLISAEELQTKTFEKTVSIAGVDIASCMTGDTIISDITASLIDPDGVKSSAVKQAFGQVVSERPDEGDFCRLSSHTGDLLNNQGVYDAAANAFEFAFGEELFYWDMKAIYSMNLITSLKNYVDHGDNNSDWLTNKQLLV